MKQHHRTARRARLVAAVALTGLLAAACGDSGGGTADTTTPTSAADTTAAAETTAAAADTTASSATTAAAGTTAAPATTAAAGTTAAAATTAGGGGAVTTARVTAAPGTTAAAAATTAAPAATTAAAAGTDPFTGTSAFCQRYDSTARRPTNPNSAQGVTATKITLLQIRQKLEDLERIGFAAPVGDTTDMFNTFADLINRCGGIWGRQVEVRTIEFSPLDASARDRLCLQATEDNKPFAIVNSNGLQGTPARCIVADKRVPYITSQGQPDEYYAAGQGRLISVDFSNEWNLRAMTQDLLARNLLQGKKVGVVAPDLGALDQVVKTVLVDELRARGVDVAAFDILQCNNTSTCTGGIALSVENMKSRGVQILLPTLNLTTLPQYLREAVTQGFRPEKIYNSNFNAMGGDLTNSKVAEFGGPQVAALYNGTEVVGPQPTGLAQVDPNIQANQPFTTMCNREYAANTKTGISYNPKQGTEYGMVGTVCTIMRLVARAMWAAGPDLTVDGYVNAMLNLRNIDANGDVPSTLSRNKFFTPSRVFTAIVNQPCPAQFGGGISCLIVQGPSRPIAGLPT